MQKRIIKTFSFLAVFFVFLFGGVSVFAQDRITNFDVSAKIEKNGSVLVTENISYDFASDYRHGIYRDIYLKDIDVKLKSVTDENGQSYKYETQKINDSLRVKIGSVSETITGNHSYIIVYLVKGAVKFLPDYDEFYWNVTGNNWLVPIENSKATALISGLFARTDLKLKCYTGPIGSTEQNCSTEIDTIKKTSAIAEQSLAVFWANDSLPPGDGLTIVFGWPKGAVSPPGLVEKILDFANKYWLFTLPLIIFIFLLIFWKKRGKDIRLNKSIVPQYDLPKEMNPALVAYILRQKITPKDISATIVDLAVRGYLKIKETKTKKFLLSQKDWIFIKQKNYETDQALDDHERVLLSKLFSGEKEVAVSSLQRKFYQDFEKVKEKISKEMVEDDYFVINPEKYRKTFLIIGPVFLGAGIVLFRTWLKFFPVSLIVSGILFIVFASFMPKKTRKGTEALWLILGFKEYISKAEKYRVQFQEKENIFEKFLPYAIIFGCTKKWAKAFKNIYKSPPSWYEGAIYGAYFSPVDFSAQLEKSMMGIGTALASKPGGGSGSSGFSGGFSGGGFGGGGGGSW